MLRYKEGHPIPTFKLFDSIINGYRMPHLQRGSFFNRIDHKNSYISLIRNVVDPLRQHHNGAELLIDNPYSTKPTYVRYRHLLAREEEGIEAVEDTGDGDRVHLRATRNIDNLADTCVPPPPTITTAYYLFLLEREHDYMQRNFMREFMDPRNSVEFLERYSNISLQQLKKLARQLQEYDNFWKGREKVAMEISEREYIIYATKQYLVKMIVCLQDLFEPYIKSSLLNENEVNQRYFNGSLKPFNTSHVEDSTVPIPSTKQEVPVPSWKDLFIDPKAADEILLMLKKEEYIAEDGRWIKHPPLLTMIALHNVLLRNGYYSSTSTPAKELSSAFNTQFTTNFSPKKWQPSERNSASFHEEKFKIIPLYKTK
jgi:hypothetical protein